MSVRPYKKKNPGSQTPPRAQNSSQWDVFIVGREKKIAAARKISHADKYNFLPFDCYTQQ